MYILYTRHFASGKVKAYQEVGGLLEEKNKRGTIVQCHQRSSRGKHRVLWRLTCSSQGWGKLPGGNMSLLVPGNEK